MVKRVLIKYISKESNGIQRIQCYLTQYKNILLVHLYGALHRSLRIQTCVNILFIHIVSLLSIMQSILSIKNHQLLTSNVALLKINVLSVKTTTHFRQKYVG